MSLLTPNIDHKGRVLRGAVSLVLLIAAGFSYPTSTWLSLLLAAAGLFAAFEAVRGWCAARACGIRTRW